MTGIERELLMNRNAVMYPDPVSLPEPTYGMEQIEQVAQADGPDDGLPSIQEIPRNTLQEALGMVGVALTNAGVVLDEYGLDIPGIGQITLKDLTIGDVGKVLEDMSYGFYPVRGGGGLGGTVGLKDEAIELLNIAPGGAAVSAGAKAAGKAVKKVTGKKQPTKMPKPQEAD